MALQVIACQTDIVWEDKRANYACVRSLLESADITPGALVILPEMFATGFSMNVLQIAEPRDGETAAFLAELAHTRRCYVLGGMVTQSPDGRGRNEAVVFDPNGHEVTRYCKLHPFTMAGEADRFEQGERPVQFACGGFQIAPFICYDLRFPEAFRRAVVAGAQVFAIIANWPRQRAPHWTTLLQARAIENQAYVVGVNRVGRDPHADYHGHSVVIDPRGTILAAAEETATVLSATLDLDGLLDYRQRFPALADARRDLLG